MKYQLTWLRQNAEIWSCSLCMMRTGSRRWGFCVSLAGRSGVSMTEPLGRLPNTALMNRSCTISCLTRKLHNLRAGAADQCLGL